MSIDGKTIDVEVDFNYQTDSLETLSVSISKSGWNYEEDVKYSEVFDLLVENFGQPQLTEKLRTQEDIFPRSFWFGDEIIIELENEGEYDDIVITFHINSQPYSLYYWRVPGYNNAASLFYDL